MTEFEFKRMVWRECLAYRIMKAFYKSERHIMWAMLGYPHDVVNAVMCPAESANDDRVDEFVWMMLSPAWPAYIMPK